MSPEERVSKAVDYGSRIHPQYPQEFENGIAVAWHRSPFTLGCFGLWSEAARAQHYDNLCDIDGRIVLAGEHASYLPGWQEGAVTSALDAIERLHHRASAAGVAYDCDPYPPVARLERRGAGTARRGCRRPSRTGRQRQLFRVFGT